VKKPNSYLHFLLESRGIKQNKLSKKMGTTPSALSRKIKGLVNFKESDIQIILKELDMSYEDVFVKNRDFVLVELNRKSYAVSVPTASRIEAMITKEQVS